MGEEQDIIDSDTNHFRYCGEYYDKETKTLYLRVRYYSSATGRFTQEDPIKDGNNWYGYCDNNPVNLSDPSGLRYVMTKPEEWGGGNTSQQKKNVEIPDVYFTSSKIDYSSFGRKSSVNSYSWQANSVSNKTSKTTVVENWLTDNGFAISQEISRTQKIYDANIDLFIGGYETGTETGSKIKSGNLDSSVTTIVEVPEKITDIFEFDQYAIGIHTNIGNGGFELGLENGGIYGEVCFGETSIALKSNDDKWSFTVRQGVSWKNQTASAYAELYTRPNRIKFVAAAVIGIAFLGLFAAELVPMAYYYATT